MGGVANLFLGRRQPEHRPHWAVEPGSGLAGLRPGAVVEPAENDDVGLLQARLERPPDEEPRMHGNARAHVLLGNEAAVEVGVVGGGHRERR